MGNKIKYIFITFIFLIIILSGCSKKETSLIDSKLMKIDNNEYVSSVCKSGDLSKTVKVSAASYFPISSDITSSTGGVMLDEVSVKSLDYVKKGDLLAVVRAYNTEEITEKEKVISGKEAELNNLINFYENEISLYMQQENQADNEYDKKIASLNLSKSKINYDYMVESKKKEIDKQKSELEKIKSASGDLNIYAPFDGVIDKIYLNSKNIPLSESTKVISMHSIESVIVYFDDPGYTYCDNEVTVYAGTGKDVKKIKGKIVCADHFLNSNIQSGKVYVRLEGDYDPESLDQLQVELQTFNAKNVLITKSTGIVTIKDKSYIYIYEDGKLKRRHVIIGGTDDKNTWILQGADKGDNVYLQ